MASDSASNEYQNSPPVVQDDYLGAMAGPDLIQQAVLSGPLYQTEVRCGPRTGTDEKPKGNSTRREIGDLAVWSLSSAKHGNGVQQLRDDSNSTFWQSDGQQPHLVNIQFLKKTRVGEIALYLDFKTDESYTP